METKQLEKFCPWARRELIDAVARRCVLFGLDDKGRAAFARESDVVNESVLTSAQKSQRAALYSRIEAKGYDEFCEEEAYCWFNRFSAIRYMEIQGFLPCHVRMLSAADGSFDPECLRVMGELDLPGLDVPEAVGLSVDGKNEEAYRRILVAQCNELAECLPEVFGQVDAADALTLPDGLLLKGDHDFLYHLVTDIPEDTWENVEVLGWMYQFYNSELHDAFYKSKRKAGPEDIAPATQLFTPEWIVRYMVENSLGRLWMLNRPNSTLREHMEYYIDPDEAHEDFIRVKSPEEITLLDPACGSGHILSYAFELLYYIYLECGYIEREIPSLILTKNLSGYEVDERAAQIACLTLTLRAREHDHRFFRREVRADVRLLESIPFAEGETSLYPELADDLSHLGEVGSLLNPTDADMDALRAELDNCTGDLFANNTAEKLKQVLAACKDLRRRFTVVVANPPYLSSSKFNPFMNKWVKKHYPDVKSDLFSSFIVRITSFAEDNGEIGIMCPFVWMFISSYEKLRKLLIDHKTLTSLIQLEYSGFAGATVPVCTFTFHNNKIDGYKGGYIRLSDFVGANNQAPKALEAIHNPACGYFYRVDASTFHQISGSPIAYWLHQNGVAAFSQNLPLERYSSLAQGLKCGDTNGFVRCWFENPLRNVAPLDANVGTNSKWHFMLDGGDYRKWAGNVIDVVNWEHNGFEIKNFKDKNNRVRSRVQNERYYHKPGCLTWSALTSGPISVRACPSYSLCGGAGYYIVPNNDANGAYILGLLNSSLAQYLKQALSQTFNNEVGDLKRIPTCISVQDQAFVANLVRKCCSESKLDWDSFETSWDFKCSPLV